jgi:hypothetical protein
MLIWHSVNREFDIILKGKYSLFSVNTENVRVSPISIPKKRFYVLEDTTKLWPA